MTSLNIVTRRLPVLLLGLFSVVTASANGGFNGIYTGTFSAPVDDGAFAILVYNDNQGRVLWWDLVDEEGAAENFNINLDGTFSFSSGNDLVNGAFLGSDVSGDYCCTDGAGTFSGFRLPADGPFADSGGLYQGALNGTFNSDGTMGTTTGSIEFIISASGNIFAFAAADNFVGGNLIESGTVGGILILEQNGDIFGVFPEGTSIDGTLNFNTMTAMGTYFFQEQGETAQGNWNATRIIELPPPLSTISQLVPLPDANNNGRADFAAPTQSGASIDIFVRDGWTGSIISSAGGLDNGAGSAEPEVGVAVADIIASAPVPDFNNNGADEVAVLSNEPDGMIRARIHDSATGDLLKSMTFPPAYVPVAMAVVPDIDGASAAALVVLGVRNDGDVKARVKDAETGANLGSVSFAPNFPPQFLAVVPDITGNNISELAALGIDAGGNIRVQLKDASTGSLIHWIQFARAFSPHAMAVIPDAPAGPAIAVLGEHADGRVSAQVKDALTRQNIIQGRVNFSRTYAFSHMTVIDDLSGNGVSELVYLGINGAGNVRAQLKDPSTKSLVNQLFYSKSFPPDAVAAFKDIDGNGQPELGVLGTNANNGNVRLQIRDASTGNEINSIFIP